MGLVIGVILGSRLVSQPDPTEEPDDRLVGLGGDDMLDGGAGFDRADYGEDEAAGGTAGVPMDLGAGTAIDGFGDADALAGIEMVRGAAFADSLTGGETGDTLEGGGGNDRLFGGAEDDLLEGGAGDDFISETSGTASNTAWAGDGADEIWGGPGDDVLTGGAAPTSSAASRAAAPRRSRISKTTSIGS